jgi:NADPH2:quinone reductase
MRAWLLDSLDGIEKLRLAETPPPPCAPGEVLLRLQFAALNPADAFLAQAMYPAKPALPHVLGRDGVGEVVAVGEGVVEPRVGETVGVLRCDAGVERWGTLAELVAVPANSVAPVPEGWSLEEMAAAPLTFLTAWQALTQWSDPPKPPEPGSTLLVTGASGGVGVAAVLLARSMGLRVAGLSRSAEKGARLLHLGADFVFDPGDSDLRRKVATALSPAKVDLAVDNVGGPLFNQLVAMLGNRGRISVVGRSGGAVPEFNTGTLFFRRNRIGGVSVGSYSRPEAQAAWKEVVIRLRSIDRRPVIDRVFAFEQVKAGFARLAESPMGKVVIRVNG